ncbi:MAG: hypothetical protein ACK4MM_05435 [Fervidobacterium sp.]
MKIKPKKLIPYGILLILIIGVVFFLSKGSNRMGAAGSTHEHADFKVYLNGNWIDFSQPKYFVRSPYIHVEGGPGVGQVLHIHATGVTLDTFFKSVGIQFSKDCFVDDNGNRYCNNGTHTLKFYVKKPNGNWEENDQFEKYKPVELDKILITYGNESPDEIVMQQESVSDLARVESGYR